MELLIKALILKLSFYQVGFILYNPLPGAVAWKDHDHGQIMIVTSLFCFHLAANLAFVALIGFLVRRRFRFQLTGSRQDLAYEKVPFKELNQEIAMDPVSN